MPDSPRIEDLRRRVQKDPASIAFAQLAEECRRAGFYEEAVRVCRAGLDLHPGYLSARVTLGRALIELNELDPALAELELVLRSAPENLAAIRGLAEIHHRRGALPQALEQYRAALALARNDPDLQQTVAELARQIEPPLPPASADGLSFEQIQHEFLKHAPPPATSAPTSHAASPPTPATAPQAVPVDRVEAPERPEEAPERLEETAEPLEETAEPLEEAAEPLEEAQERLEEAQERLEEVPERPEEIAARGQALQVIAVLEQWLDAIHVARAQPRA